MSALHRRAFLHDRGWSASEFDALLQSPHVHASLAPRGFALSRTVARETELLTLVVDPDHQRQGIARHLMRDWLGRSRQQADTAFLEVAADNHAARTLYADCGFLQVGLRANYYARSPAPAVDGLILRRGLTYGQGPKASRKTPESG